MFIGLGTLINAGAVALGSGIGLAFGSKIPNRTRSLITSTLGLITVLLGIDSALTINAPEVKAAVGSAGVIIVTMSLLLGGIAGSLIRIEDGLGNAADRLRSRFGGAGAGGGRFVDAVVTPTLLFCVGPLTILGSLSEGLGRGADQLILKSVLDGFTAIAFASSLGAGVAFSSLLVLLIEGTLTALAFFLGDFMTIAQIDVLTSTGGILLLALALRLLDLKHIAVGDLLPALVVAPLIVAFFPGA